MLQQPPTKKQSRPLQRLHVNSVGFLILPHSLGAVQEHGGGCSRSPPTRRFLRMLNVHVQSPAPSRLAEGPRWGLQDGAEELFLPEGVL